MLPPKLEPNSTAFPNSPHQTAPKSEGVITRASTRGNFSLHLILAPRPALSWTGLTCNVYAGFGIRARAVPTLVCRKLHHCELRNGSIQTVSARTESEGSFRAQQISSGQESQPLTTAQTGRRLVAYANVINRFLVPANDTCSNEVISEEIEQAGVTWRQCFQADLNSQR
jgi:hypothetical protein